jgi:hypothetical protein
MHKKIKIKGRKHIWLGKCNGYMMGGRCTRSTGKGTQQVAWLEAGASMVKFRVVQRWEMKWDHDKVGNVAANQQRVKKTIHCVVIRSTRYVARVAEVPVVTKSGASWSRPGISKRYMPRGRKTKLKV